MPSHEFNVIQHPDSPLGLPLVVHVHVGIAFRSACFAVNRHFDAFEEEPVLLEQRSDVMFPGLIREATKVELGFRTSWASRT